MSRERESEIVRLWHQYRDAFYPDSEVPINEFVKWVIKTGQFRPTEKQLESVFSREAAESLRRGTIAGTQVRKYHAAQLKAIDRETGKELSLSFWDDMERPRVSHEFMTKTIDDRGKQAIGDIASMKRDADYYNEHHKPKGKRPIRHFLFEIIENQEMERAS